MRGAALHNFKFYEVTYESDLTTLNVEPPAIAYVRSVGDFFFRHGPEYWFGRAGSPEANFSDRENNRWVRGQYSGGRGLMRATNMEYLPTIAQGLLAQLIANGVKGFDATKYADLATGDFWKVAESLWYLSHNFQLVELNEQATGMEGIRLHDIHDGDIAVESGSRAWCVQAKTKNPDLIDKYYGRELLLIGQKPVIEGTPGIHIQKAKEVRLEITESHPERIGYVIATADIPKGAMSFTAAVHPDSLPLATTGGGKQWISTNMSDTEGYPVPSLRAPFQAEQAGKPWNLRRFAWLQTPDQSVELKVIKYSPPSSGRMPDCLNATITLEQGCPVPLLNGGSVYGKTDKAMYVAEPGRSFSWMPRGIYGGYFNETEINIRVGATASENMDIGPDQQGPFKGERTIDMFKSWINVIGHRRFSHLRGINTKDFVSIENYNHVYAVRKVINNNLQNPITIVLSEGLLADVGGGTQQEDTGMWLSNHEMCWIIGELPPNPHCSFYGWNAPDGTNGIPLVVKNLNFNHVSLIAPVAKMIPAGTKMPIWISSDLDTVTYAYYDFYAFMFELEQWINYSEKITRSAVIDKLLEIRNIQDEEWARAYTIAENNAATFWYNHPYYVNRCLDDWLPDSLKKYGDTFVGASRRLGEIAGGLSRLLNTKAPAWNHEEYISLISYSHRGIPGGTP